MLSLTRLALASCLLLCLGCAPPGARSSPSPTLRDFVRARCSSDGRDAYVAWRGAVYADIPGTPARHLFDVVGMNVARCLREAGERGWLLTSRELMLYLDPVSGRPLTRWQNPWTSEEVAVVHVANSPVQAELTRAPGWAQAGRFVTFSIDVFPFYPNPLARDPDLAAHHGGAMYQSAELFTFTVDAVALGRAGARIADVAIGWQRLGPWLPWMKMRDRPGRLLYSARGQRMSSWTALPEPLRALLEEQVPLFRHAPACWLAERNMTSWTYFERHFDAYQRGEPFPRPAPQTRERCGRPGAAEN